MGDRGTAGQKLATDKRARGENEPALYFQSSSERAKNRTDSILVCISRQLRAVPDRHNPHGFTHHSIKETIWLHDDFTVRQIGKLGNRTSRFGKFLKPSNNLFCFFTKFPGGSRTVPPYVLQPFEKLSTGERCEFHLQESSSLKRVSASLRTLARVYPSPVAISFSPVAKRRNNSRSCSDFS